MRYLRKNTAVTVIVGPLVDWADGKTLLTDNAAFDPSKITCELIKNATSQILTLSKTTGENLINLTGTGMATLTLSSSNTDTEGGLRLVLSNAIADSYSSDLVLPLTEDFTVYGEGVWAALFEEGLPTAPRMWTIDPSTRQSIFVQAALDLLAVFGESIVYQPMGGSARTITAVIDYGTIQKMGGMQNGYGPQMSVSVFNHATYGVTAIEANMGGDLFIIPTRIGGTPQSRRISKITHQDDGMVVFEVR